MAYESAFSENRVERFNEVMSDRDRAVRNAPFVRLVSDELCVKRDRLP